MNSHTIVGAITELFFFFFYMYHTSVAYKSVWLCRYLPYSIGYSI